MLSVFGSKVVKEITGVSRMQLQHWETIGLIRPSIRTGSGKGSRRQYSFQDLVQLKVAKRLREEGISLQKIRKTLTYLRKEFPDLEAPLSELRLISNGVDVFVVTGDPQVIFDALKRQFVFSFALGGLITDLKVSIRNLEVPKKEKLHVGNNVFTAILTPDLEDGGYTATCEEIPAAISQGETIQEALDNLAEAIDLCLETEAQLRLRRAEAG